MPGTMEEVGEAGGEEGGEEGVQDKEEGVMGEMHKWYLFYLNVG